MSRKVRKPLARWALTMGAVLAVGTTLAACGGGSSDSGSTGSSSSGSQADLDAALKTGGTITYWSWTSTAQAQADAFMKAYPNVTVKVANKGTNTTEYTALTNSITAGSGAPDVAQIEYYAIPQYALSDSLVDLTTYGLDQLKSDYTASTWGSVAFNGKVYGLPQDSGPMALFYNAKVFKDAGINEAPKTWDDYIADAKLIHAKNPKHYITADSGDGGFVSSMIWQAGGHPFNVDGNSINVDFTDAGTKKFTAMWDQLHTTGLLSETPGWTDAWFQGLGNGDIASLVTGAWMPANLEANSKAASGDWKVAPIPTYDGTTAVTAENGGSSQAVLKQSKNPALAAAFVRWLNHDPASTKIFLDAGNFPSTTADLSDPAFTDKKDPYFGDQQVNKVLAAAAGTVAPNWSYLPIQAYALSIFGDTAGKTAYATTKPLDDGLTAWKAKIDSYAKQQGFTVK